jgi:hypothetical protein
MKSETGAVHPLHFCALRAKMYSLLVTPDETKLTAKGIKKYYVEKNLKHEDYAKTLQSSVGTVAQFNSIQSRNHVLNTVTIKKSCLSAFDDKRFLLKDGIHTLAYGHYKIASGEAEVLLVFARNRAKPYAFARSVNVSVQFVQYFVANEKSYLRTACVKPITCL